MSCTRSSSDALIFLVARVVNGRSEIQIDQAKTLWCNIELRVPLSPSVSKRLC